MIFLYTKGSESEVYEVVMVVMVVVVAMAIAKCVYLNLAKISVTVFVSFLGQKKVRRASPAQPYFQAPE